MVHLDNGSTVILFLIITLTLGMIGKEINKKTGFPYTPIIIVNKYIYTIFNKCKIILDILINLFFVK